MRRIVVVGPSGRADTVIILDQPRHLVMSRLLGRTLKRVIIRQRLWQGNQETWRNLVSRDPEENILLWSWTAHQKSRDPIYQRLEDEAFSHVQFFRFNSPRSASRMLRVLRAEP